MSKSKIHIVIIHPQYVKENWNWLQRFVFQNKENSTCAFSCNDVRDSCYGMLEFHGVMTKANDEKEDILLPSHVIVGVLLDQSHKSQLGFLNQEEYTEQW